MYSLTEAGETEFERLMFEIASKPISIFLDFNAVIVNLDSLPHEKQKECIAEIEDNIKTLKNLFRNQYRRKGKQAGDTCNRYGSFTAAIRVSKSD